MLEFNGAVFSPRGNGNEYLIRNGPSCEQIWIESWLLRRHFFAIIVFGAQFSEMGREYDVRGREGRREG